MNWINKIEPFFPSAFVHKENELILEPKNNIYFRIDNVSSDLEFDCKILHYASRSACKGLSNYWIKYFRRGLNSYFRKTWTESDWSKIYTKLGNGANGELCVKFVESGYDLTVLN